MRISFTKTQVRHLQLIDLQKLCKYHFSNQLGKKFRRPYMGKHTHNKGPNILHNAGRVSYRSLGRGVPGRDDEPTLTVEPAVLPGRVMRVRVTKPTLRHPEFRAGEHNRSKQAGISTPD